MIKTWSPFYHNRQTLVSMSPATCLRKNANAYQMKTMQCTQRKERFCVIVRYHEVHVIIKFNKDAGSYHLDWDSSTHVHFEGTEKTRVDFTLNLHFFEIHDLGPYFIPMNNYIHAAWSWLQARILSKSSWCWPRNTCTRSSALVFEISIQKHLDRYYSRFYARNQQWNKL